MKLKKWFCLILLFAITGSLFSQKYNPVANTGATVVEGNVRFTVLTPRVIRMEWSANGKFNDFASLTFVNRYLSVPRYSKSISNGELEITTEALKLKYKLNSGMFSDKNVSINFVMNNQIKTWMPGLSNNGNLFGTTRTLDQCNGAPAELEKGLISRDGWMLFDDSERPLFDNSEWPWVMARPDNKQQDLYVFTYGKNYKQALKDYTDIAGKVAMPPRFAFGAWWSRFREYTDTEFRELVGEFESHDVPLDVFVIDIDWHYRSLPGFYKNGQLQTDQAGEGYGWTGYTWDKNYFADPDKFLKWTNEKNLKTCLNLHPASGIQPFEERYPQMAKAMGIDPATKKYVPFDITDKKFATNYMNEILRPLENSGVDFWWLDWQQWGNTKIPGVNPTFYLNYVHYSDMERQNKVRPLIFHRWGGLGNHRYQIGFSGDTHNTWKSLEYQPYFTSTAANVGFGYWSHDIGGHFGHPDSPEMYTRWIQWGIFSPIFRTHCTEAASLERRIWAYPLDYFKVMHEAYLLRYSMIPYLYNEAHNTYETGVSIVHPLYYDYPDNEIAYNCPNQYMFGRDMMVAPVLRPIGKDSLFVMQKLWLPEGKWFEWSTGTMLEGGKSIEMPFTIDDIPVFVKEGAIIPMQSKASRVDDKPINPVILTIFPGKKGSTKLYEDEGNNNNFKSGAFSNTPISFENKSGVYDITISAVEGTFPGMLKARGYELRFPCSFAPTEVLVNGRSVVYKESAESGSWNYNGENFETRVYVSESATDKPVSINLKFPAYNPALISGLKAKVKLMRKFETFRVTHAWERGRYEVADITSLSQVGQLSEYAPDKLKSLIDNFDAKWNSALLVIQNICTVNNEYKSYYQLLKLYGSIAEAPVVKSTSSQIEFDATATIEMAAAKTDKIYYTIDGSQPTINSKLYNGAVSLPVPVTIKAIAYPVAGGSCSSVATTSFYKKNSGLTYKLYKGSWDKVPDFTQLVVDKQGYSYDLNVKQFSPYREQFGVVYEGYLTVPANAKYKFYLSSDDGSKLYINNQLLIDNDGLHSEQVKMGEIKLSKGQISIRIEYFQGSGGFGLSAEFESAKLTRTAISPFCTMVSGR